MDLRSLVCHIGLEPQTSRHHTPLLLTRVILALDSSLYISYDAEGCAEVSLRHRHLCKLKLSMQTRPPAQVDAPSNWIKLADFPGCIDQAKVATRAASMGEPQTSTTSGR